MADFSNAEVGDKVYCIKNGHGKITNINKESDYCISVAFAGYGSIGSYTKDGKSFSSDHFPYLYWGKPQIIEPEKPKKKVVKEIVMYANVYSTRVITHDTKEKAIRYSSRSTLLIPIAIAVEVKGTYEIEE